MIHHYIEKLRKAAWIIGQPLSRKPSSLDCPISDLFIWRKTQEWETFFELWSLPSLFGDSDKHDGYVTFQLFNAHGRPLAESKVSCAKGRRQTVRISDLLGNNSSEFGTFAVFHSNTPELVMKNGSFLAERGYVSYRYCGSPLRSYVHGNLDAIARISSSKLELLGSAGALTREFRIQHELYEGSTYELAFVNPSLSRQSVQVELVSFPYSDYISCEEISLNSGEAKIVPLQFSGHSKVRAVIKSKLVMARPLIFHIYNNKLDVFHG
jgi:hypothetical protein